jgi:hypothetical protein
VPYDDPDPSDPQLLVGVTVPGGPEAMRAMAETFADEFARLGLSAPEIMRLFDDPFYGGAHRALRALGEPVVRGIVARAVVRWPAVRIVEPPSEEER